jgi:cell division protease FtsH
MSEPKNKDNQDKAKKAKSFGPYALFLFVLIAIMIMVGGRDALKHEVELTMDEFEYELHTGQIDSLKLVGGNEIRGQYKGKKETFTVKHPGFGDGRRMEDYQQLAAIGTYRTISAAQFQEAVQNGYLRPTDARHLTAVETRETALPAAASDKPEEALVASTELAQIDRFLVRALAKPRSEWSGSGSAPDWLPTTSGEVWFEVRDVRDAQALLGSLREGSVAIASHRFNIEPKKGTSYESPDSLFGNFLIFWGPWLLILIVFFFFLRQMRNQSGSGGVMSFGRSRAQLYTKENHTNTTFDDVAGCTEAKDEVKEVVEFLKNPGRFTRLGGRIPRGILLVGPPGCGKTLLAKAIAGEADVPFFSISGSDFVEMFVGVGASRVRDLFKQAHENSPCIIFLDEIDAVGRRRGSGMGGGHDEREQTLNAILVEMDGFGTDEGIIVIAATNRPDVLDPALLRPGRFDREVVIDLPDLAGREEILRVHLKKVKAAADVDAAVLARSTPGYSGADLAAIANEAAIMAALAKKDEITMEHLEESRDKVRYGRQKRSKSFEEEDRRVTAYHEAGHAIVAAMLPEVDPPHKVTIVPRGRALGTTMMLPDKESYHFQRRKMLGQLAVAFGGRVAEAQFVGDISAGASDDIRRATELARAMVTELGMSDKVGPIHYAERQGSDFLGTELTSGKWHSEQTAREIDEEIERILKEAYETAARIVRENTEQMERITQALLIWETISGTDIKRILAGERLESLRPTPPPQRPSAPASTTPAAGTSPRTQGGELPGTPGLSPA